VELEPLEGEIDKQKGNLGSEMGLVKDLNGLMRLFVPAPPYRPEEIAAALAAEDEVLFAALSSLSGRSGFTTVVTQSSIYFNAALTASEVHHTERMIRIARSDVTDVKKHGKGFWERESVSVSTRDGNERRVFFREPEDARAFCEVLAGPTPSPV
jgi:hypothetical protein